jgi:SAM-dependent methyltransferase
MGSDPKDSDSQPQFREAALFWDHQVSSAEADSRRRQWTEYTEILLAINRRVTGDPCVPPLHALADLLRRHGGAARALSVGCGSGSLERFLVGADAVEEFDGIDISVMAVEHASTAAAAENLDPKIRYRQADALTWLRQTKEGAYDLIVFHGSLHHIDDLELVLAECARVLRNGAPGWLYLDEYIGPARDRWTDADLQPARELFAEVPASLRETSRLEAPIDPDDPSEMICSDQIEPLVRVFFDVIHFRPYFGNVTFPLLSALRADAFDSAEVRTVLERGLAREEELIAGGGARPMFAVFLARPADQSLAAVRLENWRSATGLDAFQALERSTELERTLRRQLKEVQEELVRFHGETARLTNLIAAMKATRAWRLHEWAERRLRLPWRRFLSWSRRR